MGRQRQVYLKMTKDRKHRLMIMADAMGMPMSNFIKMVLDDKWIKMREEGILNLGEKRDGQQHVEGSRAQDSQAVRHKQDTD